MSYLAQNVVRLRLFAFHYAGGSANVFRKWQESLPQAVKVMPVELPGHGARLGEPLLPSMPEVVAEVAKSIMGNLDKPFVFFGHSMGALLAFELASLLRRQFLPQPVHLIVSAHGAPHLTGAHEPIHQLPDAQFIQKLVNLNGTPEGVLNNPELRALFLPIIRNDFQVCETYKYKGSTPFDFPITVYGGEKDSEVDYKSLAAWGQHSTAGINIRMFGGDHFFIHSHAQDFLQQLSKDLKTIIV